MYEEMKRNGSAYSYKLYDKIVDGVIDAGVSADKTGGRGGAIPAMTDAINGIMDAHPEKFKHSQDPATLNTIDIAPSSIPGGAGGASGASFINGLKADPGVQRVLSPPDDKAIHVEIPQPKPIVN
jgi:hypothetical protein